MNPRDPLLNVTEALLRASEYHPPHPGAGPGGLSMPPAAALTIALSRETGAGGTSVAREVGRRLNWPVYDHELLEQIAQELRVGVSQLRAVDERPGNWLQEWAEAFAGAPAVAEPAYFRRLLQILVSLGARGECVIVGRGAAQLLPAATTLRVRLVAAREDRAATMSRLLGLPAADAARHVDTTDRERALFVRTHFRKDPADPQSYDLTLNSSRFSVAECADLIVEAVARLRARPAEAWKGAAADSREPT
jgi:cytidylate kinase